MSNYHEFLTLIHSKGFIDEENLQNIFESKDLNEYFEEKKKSGDKKPSSERAGEYDPDKCQARIWKEGFDNIQCEHSKVEGCFCKRHGNKVEEHGTWWLGIITEKRPDNPKHYNGTPHQWKTDKDETMVDKEHSIENEKPKRRRGRPPGSKNKNKKETTKKDDGLSTADLIALISQKEKEKDNQKSDDNENTFILDGISYFKNDDNTILDTSDFSLIGSIDEKGGFTFMNDELEEKHKLKIEQ